MVTSPAGRSIRVMVERQGQVSVAIDVARQVVAEAAGGESEMDVVVDEEVHIGAVPVRPTGGERSAAAES